jgi:hypothetical protein
MAKKFGFIFTIQVQAQVEQICHRVHQLRPKIDDLGRGGVPVSHSGVLDLALEDHEEFPGAATASYAAIS